MVHGCMSIRSASSAEGEFKPPPSALLACMFSLCSRVQCAQLPMKSTCVAVARVLCGGRRLSVFGVALGAHRHDGRLVAAERTAVPSN